MASILEALNYEVMTAQIVRDVFETMLLYPIQESSAEDYSTRTNVVTSAVFFAGEWKGAVVLECGEEQARLFTKRLMGIPQPTHMDDNARDTMGEIVNMIGGNLKSVLPKGVSLSIPSVVEGLDFASRIRGGSNQNVRFSFRGEAGPLWVTLVQVTETNS